MFIWLQCSFFFAHVFTSKYFYRAWLTISNGMKICTLKLLKVNSILLYVLTHVIYFHLKGTSCQIRPAWAQNPCTGLGHDQNCQLLKKILILSSCFAQLLQQSYRFKYIKKNFVIKYSFGSFPRYSRWFMDCYQRTSENILYSLLFSMVHS